MTSASADKRFLHCAKEVLVGRWHASEEGCCCWVACFVRTFQGALLSRVNLLPPISPSPIFSRELFHQRHHLPTYLVVGRYHLSLAISIRRPPHWLLPFPPPFSTLSWNLGLRERMSKPPIRSCCHQTSSICTPRSTWCLNAIHQVVV